MGSSSLTREADREQLRAARGLSLVQEDHEGRDVDTLPNGVYGFTYSPGRDSVPLFRKSTYQAFEIHKLHDGSVHYLGYLTAEDARRLRASEQGAALRVYPEPYGEATEFASLSLGEVVVSGKGPSRADGNYIGVRVVG